MAVKQEESRSLDEQLAALEEDLGRLRVAYQQYLCGRGRREPQELRARVQRAITWFVNNLPRNSTQRFRFNQLNARFQAHRQLWGRSLREIESGTYRPHLFRARVREQRSSPAHETRTAPGPAPQESEIDRLARELSAARRETEEGGSHLSREQLARVVRRQEAALRKRYGPCRVRFHVVIENHRARLRATVRRR